MKETKEPIEQHREELLREIEQLARRALVGTISETYRTCGTPGCRCHSGGPKHGPHLYVSYRGPAGKTTGYYVPEAAQASVRVGIQAWGRIQERLRELSFDNKDRLLPKKTRAQPKKKAT